MGWVLVAKVCQAPGPRKMYFTNPLRNSHQKQFGSAARFEYHRSLP